MKNIETSDIILASYLKVKGFTLDRIDKAGNRGIFVFNNVDDQTLEDFHLGKAVCEPITFNNATRTLTTATRRLNS